MHTNQKVAAIFQWYYSGGGGGLFVSNAGSGDGSGKNADNAISLTDFISRGIEAGDRILLQKGETYDIGEIDIDVANVRFDAYGVGNNPILRGSEDISGLTWTDEEDGTWSTPMAEEPHWIWIDGRCAKLAETARITILSRPSTTTIEVDPADLTGLDVVGAYCVVKDKPFSVSLRRTVTDYNDVTGIITLNGEVDVSNNVDLVLYNKFDYFVGNNEWAWESGELRVKSAASPSTLTIRSSSFDYAFKCTAKTTFRNLEFAEYYQFGVWSDEGLINVQDCSFHDFRDTAVLIERALTGAIVNNNTIERMGNNGITMRPCSNSQFNGNTITGVFMQENYGWQTWVSEGGTITVNDEQVNGAAIVYMIDLDDDTIDGSNNQFNDNVISNSGYNGISIHAGTQNQILRNVVHNCLNRLDDGGGIYIFHYRKYNVPQENTEIGNNIVYDMNGDPAGGNIGIYVDNRCRAAYVHDNVVYDATWGILLNYDTTDHTVEDNIVRGCVRDVVFRQADTGLSTLFENNVNNNFNRNILACLASTDRCIDFVVSSGSFPSWNPFTGGGSDNNYYINAATADIANSDTSAGDNLTLSELQAAFSQDANSVYRDNVNALIKNETSNPVTDTLEGIPFLSLESDSSQKIDCGTTADVQFERTDIFSFAFWFRTSNTGDQIIFSNFEDTPRGWSVIISSGPPTAGVIIFELRNTTATNRYQLITSTNYADGQWHHVLISSPASFQNSAIYLDGALAGIAAENNNLNATIVSTENVNIGSRNANVAFYDGDICQIAIWASDQAANIADIYDNGNRNIDLAQLPSPPLHYWRIQPGQNDADKFADTGTSSNKLHGTGVNDPNVATDNFVDVDLEEITEYTIPAHYGLIYLIP